MYEITNKTGVRSSNTRLFSQVITVQSRKKMQAKVQNTKKEVDDIYERDRNIKWRNCRMFVRERGRSHRMRLANSDRAAKPEITVRLQGTSATSGANKRVHENKTSPGRTGVGELSEIWPVEL